MRVLYFAWVREMIGLDEETVGSAATTVAALIDALATRGAGYARAFADPSRLRAAIDGRFVPLDTSIHGAREIAIFPPVTGG